MRLNNHINIRLSDKLNRSIELALEGNSKKSEFIRKAITDKLEIIKNNNMKKIGIINHPDFPYHEWQKITLTLWDYFDTPLELTQQEIKFANKIMANLKIDSQEEDLIEFCSRPQDFANLIVNMKRLIESNSKHK